MCLVNEVKGQPDTCVYNNVFKVIKLNIIHAIYQANVSIVLPLLSLTFVHVHQNTSTAKAQSAELSH